MKHLVLFFASAVLAFSQVATNITPNQIRIENALPNLTLPKSLYLVIEDKFYPVSLGPSLTVALEGTRLVINSAANIKPPQLFVAFPTEITPTLPTPANANLSPANFKVIVNGLTYTEARDYTVTATTITFIDRAVPGPGDIVRIEYREN